MWGFLPTAQHRPQVGVVQFSANTVYLEVVSDPTDWGLSPQDCLPPPDTHHTSTSRTPDRPASSGGSHSPLFGFESFAGVAHRTQGDTCVYWFIIKDIVKHTDREAHRARCGGRDVEVPCPPRAPPSRTLCVVHHLEAQEPVLLEFYGSFMMSASLPPGYRVRPSLGRVLRPTVRKVEGD